MHHPERLFPGRVLRWFLLFWLGLVTLWQLSGGVGEIYVMLRNQPQLVCSWAGTVAQGFMAHCTPATGILLLLMVLLGCLLWVSLSDGLSWRCSWLAFVCQGLLLLVTSWYVHQVFFALSLYLALLLGALGTFHQVRLVLLVAGGYSTLFLMYLIGAAQKRTLFWLSFNQSLPYIALLLFVVGYLVLYLQQVRTQRQLAAYAEQIEALTRLTERQRLARELHDTLSQGLVGLALQLDAVDALLTRQRPAQAQDVVRQSMKRARATLVEARRAIDDLQAGEAEITPLKEAVQEELRQFTTATGIAYQAEVSALPTLPPSLVEPVRRVIWEGLTNIARHARASQVWVRVVQEHTRILVEVRDDGVGFDPAAVPAAGHYGLPGLRERARLLGGRLEVISAPGAGTTLRFWVPQHGNRVGGRAARDLKSSSSAGGNT
jgi:NarL family two-component system sensor histidine kinase YdfH